MHGIRSDLDIPAITRHEADRQLHLLEGLGRQHVSPHSLAFCVPEADQQMARWLLSVRGLNKNQPWLFLPPGSAQAGLAAPYPTACFATVAQKLAQTHGYQIVLTGTVAEQSQSLAIAQLLSGPVVNLTGELSLGTMSGLLTLAPVLLTSHTGPVHLAAALQTPLVLVNTRSAPQTGSWLGPHRVLYTNVPIPAVGVRADSTAIVEAVVSLTRSATFTN